MPGIDDVLEREEQWFLAAVPGLPPLRVVDGGPFDIVAAQVRRAAQAPAQLFLGLTDTRSTKPAKNSATRLEHDLVALAIWAAARGGAQANLDQGLLDDALERVAQRVRGPEGDRGHGGRWWQVSGLRVALPTLPQVLAFGDAVGALGAAYTRSVTWTCVEWV